MRTQDAVSGHPASALTTTLIVFVVMYIAVFGTGVSYMLKLAAKGPVELELGPPNGDHDGLKGTPLHQRPSRPLSAASDALHPVVGTSKGV
jgi:cytochrome d ubiquinol oxidase subunit I